MPGRFLSLLFCVLFFCWAWRLKSGGGFAGLSAQAWGNPGLGRGCALRALGRRGFVKSLCFCGGFVISPWRGPASALGQKCYKSPSGIACNLGGALAWPTPLDRLTFIAGLGGVCAAAGGMPPAAGTDGT